MTTTKGRITTSAPAKINLSLHVTGQRSDGYHLLDSLVMFTALGDEITVTPADTLSLTIDGPFGNDLVVDDTNLVLRAARTFDTDQGAAITLTKNLPVASGIGGGSADAAATLRALSDLWDLPVPDGILDLGADVPVCMTSEISRMRGIGERIETFGPAPILDLLLVNPRVEVPTGAVFGGLVAKDNRAMDATMPDPFNTDDWIEWLTRQRNDLERPARQFAPVIGEVLDALGAQSNCTLARMSGSGATCFAMFEDGTSRDLAAETLRAAHPDWWIAPTEEAPI